MATSGSRDFDLDVADIIEGRTSGVVSKFALVMMRAPPVGL